MRSERSTDKCNVYSMCGHWKEHVTTFVSKISVNRVAKKKKKKKKKKKIKKKKTKKNSHCHV
jgi:phosphoserine aminotransferase